MELTNDGCQAHDRVNSRQVARVTVHLPGQLSRQISHIIKGRPFGVGLECLAHSLQERNTLYD
jgi:hypothetical protein